MAQTKIVVTMKGGQLLRFLISRMEIKTNQGAQQVLSKLIITSLEEEYGSKSFDKEVDKELAKQKQLGNQFDVSGATRLDGRNSEEANCSNML